MFICDACTQVTKPGQPRHSYYLYKRDGNIARDLGLCPSCAALANNGHDFDRIVALYVDVRAGERLVAEVEWDKSVPVAKIARPVADPPSVRQVFRPTPMPEIWLQDVAGDKPAHRRR